MNTTFVAAVARRRPTAPVARRPRQFRHVVTSAVALLLLCGLTWSIHAQPYDLDWFTVDGGGSASAGGNFMLSGTIGQPDAGAMSGGNFRLAGGFWPGVAVAIPEGPGLLIQLVGGGVSLSWSPATPGFVLEMTDDLIDSLWTAAPAGNPVTISTSGSAVFYRLRKR